MMTDADVATVWGRCLAEALRPVAPDLTAQDGYEVWTGALGPLDARSIAGAGERELEALTRAARDFLETDEVSHDHIDTALTDAKYHVGPVPAASEG